MAEAQLAVLIACLDDLTDAVHLNLITSQVQGHQLRILVQSFTDGKGCLFAQIAASHAQVGQSLALMHQRD